MQCCQRGLFSSESLGPSAPTFCISLGGCRPASGAGRRPLRTASSRKREGKGLLGGGQEEELQLKEPSEQRSDAHRPGHMPAWPDSVLGPQCSQDGHVAPVPLSLLLATLQRGTDRTSTVGLGGARRPRKGLAHPVPSLSSSLKPRAPVSCPLVWTSSLTFPNSHSDFRQSPQTCSALPLRWGGHRVVDTNLPAHSFVHSFIYSRWKESAVLVT